VNAPVEGVVPPIAPGAAGLKMPVRRGSVVAILYTVRLTDAPVPLMAVTFAR
jgi:hypothetical protein